MSDGFGSAPYSSSPLSAGYVDDHIEWVPYIPESMIIDPVSLRQTPGYGASPYGSSPGAGGEDFPPFIGSWEPLIGVEVRRMDTIEFDVVDDYGLVDTHVVAIFPAGVIEDVFSEADGFASQYARGSGRRRIENGYRYVLRRLRGWPSASVRIAVTATDIAENIATSQASF